MNRGVAQSAQQMMHASDKSSAVRKAETAQVPSLKGYFEDDIESLQLRLDSQMRDNEDLKISLQLNKESLQSMMLESQRTA